MIAVYLLLGLVIILLAILLVRSYATKKDDSTTLLLSNQIGQINNSILSQANSTLGTIKGVHEELARISEISRQVLGMTEKITGLEKILKNTTQRGALGEFFLEAMLANIFSPEQYQMEYSFRDGAAVDAAIFVGEKIIPIDSKFPLENYNRIIDEEDEIKKEQAEKAFKIDLKKRIEETSKYVRPREGTTDFAMMFIPAEAIYYDLLSHGVGTLDVNTKNLIDYAFSKKVIIASPNMLYAYLQTILGALNALKVEKSVEEIKKHVDELGNHLRAYSKNFIKLGNHLKVSVNAYNDTGGEFSKINKDIFRITESDHNIDAETSRISDQVDILE